MKQAILPALLVLVTGVSAAVAQTEPRLSGLVAQIEAQGYRVSEAELDAGLIEAKAFTAEGLRVELRVDAATGRILRQRADD